MEFTLGTKKMYSTSFGQLDIDLRICLTVLLAGTGSQFISLIFQVISYVEIVEIPS